MVLGLGRRAALSLVFVVLIGSALSVLPNSVSAREYSGTSPSFSTGESWGLSVDYCGVGDVISWIWTTSDNLGFRIVDTPSMIEHYGFSNYDGYVVDTAGWYWLEWTNNNLFFSASVSYGVIAFTPSLTITTPTIGSYIDAPTVSVQGTFDGWADGVLVGPDVLHLREATIVGTDWGLDNYPLNEGQNTILVRSYYLLDYFGYKNHTIDRTVSVVVDTSPPELAIMTPLNDTCVYGDLIISWQCSDSNGIFKTEIKFDAWDWQAVTGTNYSTMSADGNYNVQVRVTDAAGNQAVQSVTFTVDSTPPDLVLVSPAGITPSTDTYLKSVDSIVWQCSDENGIAKREVKIDTLGWVEVTTDSYPVQLSDGEHIVQIRVTDVAGNEIECVIDFVSDKTPPQVAISSPVVNSKISKNEATIQWDSSDQASGIDRFEVQVDGGDWKQISGGSSAYQLTLLRDGWHSVTVKAVDRSGNAATSTVSFGIYTSIWSQNGPYSGIPLYAVIAAIIVTVVVLLFLGTRRRKGGTAVVSVPKEEPTPQAP